MQKKVRLMVHTILFPYSYFDGQKIDEDIQNEYEAALDTGPSEGQNLYAFYRAVYHCLNHRLLDN